MRARSARRRAAPAHVALARLAPFWLALSLATGLLCSVASAAPTAATAKLAGCYHFALSRSAPTATDADGHSLRRTVDFFAELSTTKVDDVAEDYAVHENRSTGFGRLFKQAHWRVEKSRNVSVIFSDGYEEWAATLVPASTRMTGKATYTGDVDHPERHWSATASRYSCRR